MKSVRLTVVSVVLGSLCVAALAGDINCTVTYRGAAAAAVKVALTPGGTTAMTDAAGRCTFARPRAGTYSVLAQKVIGGALVAAIKDGVVVAAGPRAVAVSLAMTAAVRFSAYIPLKTGNKWEYDESIAGATKVKSEVVTGTEVVSGVSVPVIQVTRAGSPDVQKRYWRSGADGFTIYGEAEGADMMTWVPPVNVPEYLPLLFSRATNYTVHHSGGVPDDACRMDYQFAALENVTVPAGVFAKCVKLTVAVRRGGVAAGTMTVWFAKGVGIVKQIENKPGKVVTKVLKGYSIVP